VAASTQKLPKIFNCHSCGMEFSALLLLLVPSEKHFLNAAGAKPTCGD